MKKLFVAVMILGFSVSSAFCVDYDVTERVPVVGKILLEKNGLPADTTFQVIESVADNSHATDSNIIYVSSSDLSYAGNDNEVAAVVSNEIGHIINGRTAKNKFRTMAKNAITSKLSSENIISTAANSEYLENKTSLNDNKAADITGADLMINAGYNPLAMVVVITKRPGSTFEILQGKPANTERAMNVFDYLTYNYPSKVSAGYGCQEYRTFLTYSNPIVQERNANEKKLSKFNKEQEKNKKERVKNIAKFKATGASGWDTSYALLQAFTTKSAE